MIDSMVYRSRLPANAKSGLIEVGLKAEGEDANEVLDSLIARSKRYDGCC